MTVTIDQAKAQLTELIAKTAAGESVIITGLDDHPVAELVPVRHAKTPKLGFAKGKLHIVSDDDEHLNDFKDYMPK